MLRYYGWYSNKMRGQRSKRARDAEEIAANESAAIGNDFAATAEHGCGVRASTAVEIIEHLATKPRLRRQKLLIKNAATKISKFGTALLYFKCGNANLYGTSPALARDIGKANSYQSAPHSPPLPRLTKFSASPFKACC